MTDTDLKPICGLGDAQQRSRDTLAYRLGASIAEPIALLLIGTLLLLAAWKAAELVGVL